MSAAREASELPTEPAAGQPTAEAAQPTAEENRQTAGAIQRAPEETRIWKLLEEVTDPEIPVLTLADLGVLREVRVEGAAVRVVITPTYSGCPAMDTMVADIHHRLAAAGFGEVTVRTVLAPAWTTDWLSEAGRAKLAAFGIAPPARGGGAGKTALLGTDAAVPCPRCGARDTECISPFGSTACKAHYRCRACLEPFDSFKCI